MSSAHKPAVWLYLANASLLAAHEIDSAFWHEWDLFGLPGGIELFLVVNLALLAVVLYGFERVVLWRPGARAFSYILAAAGIFAFSIHMVLIGAGHPEFRAPVSLALLAGTLLVSVAQILVVAGRERPC